MATITFSVPETVSEGEARLLLSLKLFETGRVSCGQAAELAGYSKRAFMELLGQQRLPVFNYAADEVACDIVNA